MRELIPGRIVFLFLLSFSLILAGCSGEKFVKPDIKEDFCGPIINFQYCKCAFHNQYCDNIGMTKSEARTQVYSTYDAWVGGLFAEWSAKCSLSGGVVKGEKCFRKEGVSEYGGNLYLNSKPGEVLELTDEDLPIWARGKIATVGSQISTVGPPDTIISGDENVLLNGAPIARINDSTEQGGIIVEGKAKIFVNGRQVALIGDMAVTPIVSGVVPGVGGVILP